MSKDEKKPEPEAKKPEEQKLPMRQIVIETDGSNINLVKNETAGVLELTAVLQTILTKLLQQK